MYPVLFKIGNFEVMSHGVFMVSGIIIAILLAFVTAKKLFLNRQNLIDNLVIVILAGIIGSRISYYVVYHQQFRSWLEIFYIWDGGLISFGGFIFGAVALIVLLKYQQENVRPWLDSLAPPFFLGLLFARIGDLLSGEYAGQYLGGKELFNYFSVFPTPFFESALALLLFIATLYLYEKISRKTPGLLFSLSAVFYLVFRFIIDFWRDDEGILFGLSMGQIVGLILICVLLVLWLIIFSRERSSYENRSQVFQRSKKDFIGRKSQN